MVTRTDLNTELFISPWNILENWLMPQLNEDSNDYIFQQDGSWAHYKDVRGYLNRNLPQRWIGRTGKDDALMRWPPRSPDLTPCDIFFWGFVKDTVCVPPLPANLQIFAILSPLLWLWFDRNMLTRVWNEMDYRIDVCRFTKGTWALVKYV